VPEFVFGLLSKTEASATGRKVSELAGGEAVGVGVTVEVGDGPVVGLLVGVRVGVLVAVFVGDGVGPVVGVLVGVRVGVLVGVLDGVGVGPVAKVRTSSGGVLPSRE
jgi:hypothetical protein